MKRRQRTSVVYERAWSETMIELFDLVGADWQRPATIKVRRTARGATVTALFVSPDGVRFTATARCREAGGRWTQVSESLGIAFTLRGAAA
ncbi:MAG TPA: hypothetical protein VMU59_14255 [Caulobacteraceae bacterium]|nr:hypothetical protein [Caulobacteraceae bacterium]